MDVDLLQSARALLERIDPRLAAFAFALSIAVMVGFALLVPVVVARMPADYFVQTERPRKPLHALAFSLLGGALVLLGIALLVLPGQGVLTILAGLSLLRFPGKRKLELYLVTRPSLAKAIDALRRRAGRPPLQRPPR